jgi:UDP-N-acetyl-D-glucosamine dehydrogenase
MTSSAIDTQAFVASFTSGERKLGIIGQGYVGLPLAEAFGEAGIKVLGFDIDQSKVDAVNRGESYIGDVSTESLKKLVDAGLIEATTDFDRLGECGAISICVPTPLAEGKQPDMKYIEKSVESVRQRLQQGQMVILESTTYPGTTEEYVRPQLESTGLKAGEGFYLAFSPERVDPGNPKYGVKNTPKIIGGSTDACTALSHALYAHALKEVHAVSSTRAAELVKLLENTFRAINIGFINEFAKMCKYLEVDVWEVIEAAKTKPFGFMPFYPGPGLGGHCIPIDPLYLAWKLSHLNYKAQFIELADSINTNMPEYVVNEVMEQLNEDSLALKGSRILVLGMAYKEDIDDVRESPSLFVVGNLLKRGAKVVYHDPHVRHETVQHVLEHELHIDPSSVEQVELTAEEIKRATLVFIATAHQGIDYNWVVEQAPRVFDAKNATGKLGIKSKKVRRL